MIYHTTSYKLTLKATKKHKICIVSNLVVMKRKRILFDLDCYRKLINKIIRLDISVLSS